MPVKRCRRYMARTGYQSALKRRKAGTRKRLTEGTYFNTISRGVQRAGTPVFGICRARRRRGSVETKPEKGLFIEGNPFWVRFFQTAIFIEAGRRRRPCAGGIRSCRKSREYRMCFREDVQPICGLDVAYPTTTVSGFVFRSLDRGFRTRLQRHSRLDGMRQ